MLVDSGKDAWGGEVTFRAKLEQRIREELGVSGVLLVVHVRAHAARCLCAPAGGDACLTPDTGTRDT